MYLPKTYKILVFMDFTLDFGRKSINTHAGEITACNRMANAVKSRKTTHSTQTEFRGEG